MSADNYSRCPKCKRENEKEIIELEKKISDSYGKIPATEYLALLQQRDHPRVMEETLREDYEFFLNDELLQIRYSCSCSICKFEYKFERDIDINP